MEEGSAKDADTLGNDAGVRAVKKRPPAAYRLAEALSFGRQPQEFFQAHQVDHLLEILAQLDKAPFDLPLHQSHHRKVRGATKMRDRPKGMFTQLLSEFQIIEMRRQPRCHRFHNRRAPRYGPTFSHFPCMQCRHTLRVADSNACWVFASSAQLTKRRHQRTVAIGDSAAIKLILLNEPP
ncbi:MAG TPA: hypothetical protein VKA67_01220 [Verrucomicrobiae bacterium]|nr:hypothetical protein [Verrucomicrobiae bacterium]